MSETPFQELGRTALANVQQEVLLSEAAKRTGRTSTRLALDLRAHGFVVMGRHKSRRVFVSELEAFQRMMAANAYRENVEAEEGPAS